MPTSWRYPPEIRERAVRLVFEQERTIRRSGLDNALAESVIGLYKTELVKNLGPWTRRT